MKEKKSLYLYREEKTRMSYEECYSNTFKSELLAKARTNSMQLADWYGRGKKGKEDTSCPLCKQPLEDLVHFLIDCKELNNYRNKEIMNTIKKKRSKIDQVKTLLFRLKKWNEIAEMIQIMWNKRKSIIDNKKNTTLNPSGKTPQ